MLRVCMDCLTRSSTDSRRNKTRGGRGLAGPSRILGADSFSERKKVAAKGAGKQMLLTCESGDRNVLADSVNRVFRIPWCSP